MSARQEILASSRYLSGEEFTAARMAAFLNRPLQDIQVAIGSMLDMGEVRVRRGHSGSAFYYRPTHNEQIRRSWRKHSNASLGFSDEQAAKWHR